MHVLAAVQFPQFLQGGEHNPIYRLNFCDETYAFKLYKGTFQKRVVQIYDSCIQSPPSGPAG